MTDIYTYLKDYREEEPEWIARYLRGEQITFKDIMSTRVGYFLWFYQTFSEKTSHCHQRHSSIYEAFWERNLLYYLFVPRIIHIFATNFRNMATTENLIKDYYDSLSDYQKERHSLYPLPTKNSYIMIWKINIIKNLLIICLFQEKRLSL